MTQRHKNNDRPSMRRKHVLRGLPLSSPAALALALGLGLAEASCSQEEDLGPAGPDTSATEQMVFQPTIKTSSRAGVTSSNGATGTSLMTSFAVYAYGTEGDANGQPSWLDNMGLTGAGLLKSTKYTTGTDPGDPWSYGWEFPAGKRQNWPKGGTVDFYAVSPQDAKGLSSGGSTAADLSSVTATDFLAAPQGLDGTKKYVHYTVPSATADQEDFLVALTQGLNAADRPVIPLRFQHALSRVTVAVRMGDDTGDDTRKNIYYTVNSLRLIHLRDEGYLPMSANTVTEADKPSDGIPASGLSDKGTTSSLGFSYDKQATNSNGYCVLWQTLTGEAADAVYSYTGLNKDVTFYDTSTDNGHTPGYNTVTDGGTAHKGEGDTEGYVSLFDTSTNDALMVLPQELPIPSKTGQAIHDDGNDDANLDAGAYLCIEYTVSEVGKTPYQRKRYIPVKGPASDKGFTFEIGRQYRFLLDLNDAGSDIGFRVNVSDWDDKTGESPVIDKLTNGFPVPAKKNDDGFTRGIKAVAGSNTTAPTVARGTDPGSQVITFNGLTNTVDLAIQCDCPFTYTAPTNTQLADISITQAPASGSPSGMPHRSLAAASSANAPGWSRVDTQYNSGSIVHIQLKANAASLTGANRMATFTLNNTTEISFVATYTIQLADPDLRFGSFDKGTGAYSRENTCDNTDPTDPAILIYGTTANSTASIGVSSVGGMEVDATSLPSWLTAELKTSDKSASMGDADSGTLVLSAKGKATRPKQGNFDGTVTLKSKLDPSKTISLNMNQDYPVVNVTAQSTTPAGRWHGDQWLLDVLPPTDQPDSHPSGILNIHCLGGFTVTPSAELLTQCTFKETDENGADITTDGKTFSSDDGTVYACYNSKGSATFTVHPLDDGGVDQQITVRSDEKIGNFPAGNQFAYSNIYVDASNPNDPKLAFDTGKYWKYAQGCQDTHKKCAGVYFEWGSLTVISGTGQNGGYWTINKSGNTLSLTAHAGKAPDDYWNNNSTTTILDAAHDICRYISNSNWIEGKWRMPTQAELNAIATGGNAIGSSVANANNETGTIERNLGIARTINSVSYWFPAAGCINYGSPSNFVGYGYYWSTTPSSSDANNAMFWYFGGGGSSVSGGSRSLGMSVRCVKDGSN